MTTWQDRADALIANLIAGARSGDWREPDRAAVIQALDGISPSSGRKKPGAGARMVFNISSAHVPGFARPSGGYRNRYTRIGGVSPSVVDPRRHIDDVLAGRTGAAGPSDLHYGAVELNGPGIRFYGDICLVLSEDAMADDTPVLDRNSFDMLAAPLRARCHRNGTWDAALAVGVLDEIAGNWSQDLAAMAVCKVLGGAADIDRRMTVGMISQGVLDDEDYLEVIRISSFNVSNLAEARTAAADAAVDGRVADRMRRGPLPSWPEMLWRHRRRRADQALQAHGVVTRLVIGAGRALS